MASYLVPAGWFRREQLFGNSRFIATAERAGSAEEAHAFIRSIRGEMPDATHHVYAFRAGFGASVTEGVSDDGEPSGTSGPPVLAVLRGSAIGDIVVVVTRYFGGTKLGTGGLVTAYSESAKGLLSELPVEEKVERVRVLVQMGYGQFELVRRQVHAAGGLVEQESFGGDVRLVAAVPRERLADLEREVGDATAGSVRVEILPAETQGEGRDFSGGD